MTPEYAERMVGKNANYPVLCLGTTQDDLDEALWVLKCHRQMKPLATTWVDLELHLKNTDPSSIGKDNVDYNDIPFSQLSAGMREVVEETSTAKKTKDSMEKVTNKRKKIPSTIGTITDEKRE